MSILEDHWRARRARFEDGIAWGYGEFAELCGSPDEGYRADLRVPVDVLLKAEPEGWTPVEESGTAEREDFVIHAGATSAEGGGFIAVERRSTGRLEWILHLSNSEPFVKISCDDAVIHAVSEEYPCRWKWKIPIDEPEALSVRRAG